MLPRSHLYVWWPLARYWTSSHVLFITMHFYLYLPYKDATFWRLTCEHHRCWTTSNGVLHCFALLSIDSQQFMSHLKAFQLLPSWPGADTVIPTFYSTDLHCASSIAAASQGLTSKHHVSWPGAELDHGLFHCPALWAMHFSWGGGGGGGCQTRLSRLHPTEWWNVHKSNICFTQAWPGDPLISITFAGQVLNY